jgi:signal transduction histidine kinase
MAVMRDSIRSMMERETAQRRSAQSRLIDALESSREGMVLVDAAGRVVIANSQIGAYLPPLAPHLVAGADFNAALAAAGPFLRHPGASQNDALGEGEFECADGRWIRISRSTTRDGGFFLFLSDFTEVKERERSYREAQEQAEAASRAKSSFLATMSHELRTPLNAIIGFSDIMAGEMFGAHGNPHYRQYAADILHSGRHLLEIIDGVLDLAKSETGKLTIEREPVAFAAVLEASVEAIREPCARAALRLETTAIDLPAIVLGDASKLLQIFGNLLSNAVKFTEPGGLVSVHAGTLSDGRVVVTVADTGIGMTAEDITVALAPFGQVDSRLARRYEGTGLGLPLAKTLTELHGGTLLIASAPGKGTSVTVTLPALQTAGEADTNQLFARAS